MDTPAPRVSSVHLVMETSIKCTALEPSQEQPVPTSAQLCTCASESVAAAELQTLGARTGSLMERCWRQMPVGPQNYTEGLDSAGSPFPSPLGSSPLHAVLTLPSSPDLPLPHRSGSSCALHDPPPQCAVGPRCPEPQGKRRRVRPSGWGRWAAGGRGSAVPPCPHWIQTELRQGLCHLPTPHFGRRRCPQ